MPPSKDTRRNKAYKQRRKEQGRPLTDKSPSRRLHSRRSLNIVQAARSAVRVAETALIRATRRTMRWINERILAHAGPPVVEVVQDFPVHTRGPNNRLHPIQQEIERLEQIKEHDEHIFLLPRDGPVRVEDEDGRILVRRLDLLAPGSDGLFYLTDVALSILADLERHPHTPRDRTPLPSHHRAAIQKLFNLMQSLFPAVTSIDYGRFDGLTGEIVRSLAEHETGHYGTWWRYQDHALVTGDTRAKRTRNSVALLLSLIRVYVLPPLALDYHKEQPHYFRRTVEFWAVRRIENLIYHAGDAYFDLGSFFTTVALKSGATDLPHTDWGDAGGMYTTILMLNGRWRGADLLVSDLSTRISSFPGQATNGLFRQLRHLSTPTHATCRRDRPLLTLFTCAGMLPIEEGEGRRRVPFDEGYGGPHPGLRHLSYHTALCRLIYRPDVDEPFAILAAVDAFVAEYLGIEKGFWSDEAARRA